MRRALFAPGLISATLVACAFDGLSNKFDCTEPLLEAPCGLFQDSGLEGGAVDAKAEAVAPPGCDLTKDPKDSPSCVDESVAIFASPSGDDVNSGTRAAPVRTLPAAIALAASRSAPRVYVCAGTYDTTVELTAAVSIVGGMSCDWELSSARPKIAPATGIALRIVGVAGPVRIVDVDVEAQADASKPGDSAIAAFVASSADVKFVRTNLTAGLGTAGTKGETRSNFTGASATKGGDVPLMATSVAGVGPQMMCTDGAISKGGDGASGAGAGAESGSAMPAVGGANVGTSGGGECTPGATGANGPAPPAPQPALAGTLTASGWVQTALAAGSNGRPGQGGGGGGAKTDLNFAGGAGGAGGCGGAGGGSGVSGGSSFTLLSFQSTVAFQGGALTTAAGGAGGGGADGQSGQNGGARGLGACNGASGGHGAGGNGGNGGAGGHSVPVAFVGPEPVVTGAALTPGPKGQGGAGGAPGAGMGNAGAVGADGPDGKSQGTLGL